MKNILSARYGKDVRQSIHDAIKEVDSVADTAQGSATEKAAEAETSARVAAECERKALEYSNSARESAELSESKSSETALSAEQAKDSADTASTKAAEAASSANNAKTSEINAQTSAQNAQNYSEFAKSSENNAKSSENNSLLNAQNSQTSAENAKNSEESAERHSTTSKSYAIGGTGTRDNEDVDNAKYYYEQTKQVSQGLNGIIPQGTVTFANLPTSGMEYGHMYNISDEFVSDERFNDGGGVYYGPGNNVIWISGDLWDVTAGSSVIGVKGKNESTYRQGNVELSADDIGAVAKEDVDSALSSTSENPVQNKALYDELLNKRIFHYKDPTIFGAVFGAGSTTSLLDMINAMAAESKVSFWINNTDSFPKVYDEVLAGISKFGYTAVYGMVTITKISGLNAIVEWQSYENASHACKVTYSSINNVGWSEWEKIATVSHNHTGQDIFPASVELIPAQGSTHGGYIDFHYGGSSADYTSRIIEDASGHLSITGDVGVKSLYADQGVSAKTNSGTPIVANSTTDETSIYFQKNGGNVWAVGKGTGGIGDTFGFWNWTNGNVMTLTPQGQLSTVSVAAGDGLVNIWGDNEGGNIRIYAPDRNHFWEMDAIYNNAFRLFHYNGSEYDYQHTFGCDFVSANDVKTGNGISLNGLNTKKIIKRQQKTYVLSGSANEYKEVSTGFDPMSGYTRNVRIVQVNGTSSNVTTVNYHGDQLTAYAPVDFSVSVILECLYIADDNLQIV